MTRRALLLSLPALVMARQLVAQVRAAPLRVRALQQVTLAVSDLGRSREFYQGLFGMSVLVRDGAATLLRIGDGPQFLALTEAGADPPRIDHFGMAVEEFDVGRVVRILAGHGVTGADGGEGLSGGAMSVRVTTRGNTREVHMGDPDGLVIQLQDPTYCGGSGPFGDACTDPEPASGVGSLALTGLSHFTINVPDPPRSNAFYQQTFGLDVQAFQAASPLLGVGPGAHFLMFIGAGVGRGRGGIATTTSRPASINHVCFAVENFSIEGVQQALEEYGIRARGTGPRAAGPQRHWVSMRMPNRGGAPEGTPELYFTDPDGLSIQLQDVTYCGGGGYLGGECD